MQLLGKFLHLPPRLYYLYTEVVLLSAVIRIAILLVPFHQLAKSLATGKSSISDALSSDDVSLMEEIGLAVTRVSHFTPWRCMCLEQGLIAKILLKQRGISSTLVFGVASQDSNKIIAHAWLHCEGKLVVGSRGMEEFNPIAAFT